MYSHRLCLCESVSHSSDICLVSSSLDTVNSARAFRTSWCSRDTLRIIIILNNGRNYSVSPCLSVCLSMSACLCTWKLKKLRTDSDDYLRSGWNSCMNSLKLIIY